MVECRNCHAELTGKFCSNCGQSSEVDRLKFTSLLNLASNHLFDIDAKIIRTFIDLLIKPGEVCRDYILGKRKSYMNPVNYYLISGTLIILLTSWFPRDFSQIASTFNPSFGNMDPAKAQLILDMQKQLILFVMEHFRLINLLIYLFLPLFLSFFFKFKKFSYSTTDFYIFVLFIASQINFISAPIHIISYYFELSLLNTVSIVIAPFYVLYGGLGLFKKMTGSMVVKLVLSAILSFLVYVLLLGGTFMFFLFDRLKV